MPPIEKNIPFILALALLILGSIGFISAMWIPDAYTLVSQIFEPYVSSEDGVLSIFPFSAAMFASLIITVLLGGLLILSVLSNIVPKILRKGEVNPESEQTFLSRMNFIGTLCKSVTTMWQTYIDPVVNRAFISIMLSIGIIFASMFTRSLGSPSPDLPLLAASIFFILEGIEGLKHWYHRRKTSSESQEIVKNGAKAK